MQRGFIIFKGTSETLAPAGGSVSVFQEIVTNKFQMICIKRVGPIDFDFSKSNARKNPPKIEVKKDL